MLALIFICDFGYLELLRPTPLVKQLKTIEQAGLTAADVEIADWLRKHYSKKNVILAVNKCESPKKGFMQASEFWSLG